ncbi:NUDIX domain-containing protein [Paenibacillus tundrae]|uniref:NUDIX domain-containing protein n=1 Tax=Paenibacillus tundrae TaxID=528187 RepID=UPI0030D37442
MSYWYDINEIMHDEIQFAIMLTTFNDKFIIIHNSKRGGWEIPGGNREPGETMLETASRELYEETGAVEFELTPYGIYKWNGSLGMVFHAKVEVLDELPDSEISEIKFEDNLPAGMNFGDMFYLFSEKWDECADKQMKKYTVTIKNSSLPRVITIAAS